MIMGDVYNEQWYADVVAPESLIYDDGVTSFRYELKDGKASNIYGYAGIQGVPDIGKVRAALGVPMFLRHSVDHHEGSKAWPTRVIPCASPWLAKSPHLAEARRAERFGVVATNHGSSLKALTDFRDEYYKAMDRKDAADKYYNIAKRLELWADNPQVMVVTAPGAGAIFLLGDPWSHYHLSYRTPQAHNTAMHAIFDLAVPLIAERGSKFIHLGGGTTAKTDDPLYKFKSRIGRMAWTVYFQEVP